MSEKRSFTVVSCLNDGHAKSVSEGRYLHKEPKGAAMKAYTEIAKNLSSGTQKFKKTLTITIRETTKGSAKKEYTYNIRRVKLSDPVETLVKSKDKNNKTVTKSIIYNFKTEAKAVK